MSTTSIKSFLDANKVLIFGLLGAIGLTIQQYTGPTVDYKVMGLAVLIASIGFLANNLRGQWATILGSLLPTLAIIMTNVQSHVAITWYAIFASAASAIGGVFAPPAKSLAYEQAPGIIAAKEAAAASDAANSKTTPISR